jgi:sugar lactone lactonase YvrE
MTEVKDLTHCQCQCGESPVWDPRQAMLFWPDTEQPLLAALDPRSGSVKSWKTPRLVQAIGPRAGGGWVAVVRDGFALLDAAGGELRFLGNPVEGIANMTMNDGTVGPDGRYYAGSFDGQVLDAPRGSIYRLDHDGSFAVIETGLVLPNGMAFSPDGKTLYVTEMFARRITAFDFDPRAGSLAGRRVVVTVPDDEGYPDGLIVDAEGFLWSGHWQGFRVTRYDPDGKKQSSIPVPVPTATCMAFGGRDLDELFITTARKGLTPEQLAAYPTAGDLYVARPGVRGRLENAFTG